MLIKNLNFSLEIKKLQYKNPRFSEVDPLLDETLLLIPKRHYNIISEMLISNSDEKDVDLIQFLKN